MSTTVYYCLDGRNIPYVKTIPVSSDRISVSVLRNYLGREFVYFVEEWFYHKGVWALREITNDKEIIKPCRDSQILVYLESLNYNKDLATKPKGMNLESLIRLMSEMPTDFNIRPEALSLRIENMRKVTATMKSQIEAASKAKAECCLDIPVSQDCLSLVEGLERSAKEIREEIPRNRFYADLHVQLEDQVEEISKLRAWMVATNEKWCEVMGVAAGSNFLVDELMQQITKQEVEITNLKADNAMLKKKMEQIEKLGWMLKPADELQTEVCRGTPEEVENDEEK